MKVAAFLFDLDGTLVDTEVIWAQAMADYVVSCGGKTTGADLLPMVVGHSWIDIHTALHRDFPELGEKSALEDAEILREFYSRRAGDPSSMVIASSVEFFNRVASIAPCAIVSGSPHDDIIAAAKTCGIRDKLALVLGAGEYEAGKPSASGYLKAAKLLGVDPRDCVVIEDSTAGVASGVAAGMNVIALARDATGVKQSFDGAKWCVGDLSEIDIAKEFL